MKLKAVRLYDNAVGVHTTVDDIADMLRYDTAFVRGDDPSRVLLVSFAGEGALRLEPTHGRWRTYSSALTKATEQPSLDTILCEQELWTTRQHPRALGGETIYDSLMSVKLASFIKAKTLHDVRRLLPSIAH